MRPERNALSTVLKLITCATLAVGVVANAAEKKSDPAGSWTWSVPARNGGADRTNNLTLKVEGDKLTGALAAPGRDGQINTLTIADGKVTGDDVSFSVTREFNGNTMTSKYTGKLSGDTIKGKIEFERNGEPQTRDWEAKRRTNAGDATDKTEKK
jgi:hypothetical protein